MRRSVHRASDLTAIQCPCVKWNRPGEVTPATFLWLAALIVILLVPVLVAPLAAQETCTKEALCTERSTWSTGEPYEEYTYYLDGQGNRVYQGTRTYWRKDGIISRQWEYEDGVEVRSKLWSFDFGTAQPSQYVETDTSTGVRLVTEIRYFQNGCKSSEMHWADNLITGISSTWSGCNVLYAQSEWQYGKVHGWSRIWDPDTEMRSEAQYKNGIQHGVENIYYACADGSETMYQYTYRDGVLNGPAKEDPTSYFVGCKPDGLWSGQYGNGTRCGSWTSPVGGTPRDYGACEALEVPQEFAYTEIKPDDPLVQKEVRGQVVDWDTIVPIADAVVKADGVGSVTTDSSGFFRFTLGTGDQYTISIGKEGYNTRTGTFSLAGIQYKRINTKLKKAGVEPAITSVTSQYGNFFLEGLTVNNRYTVSVDWRGAEPGVVKFAVNGVVSEVAATGGEVSKSFNMGSEFKAGFGTQTNNLQIVAVAKDGARSAVEKRHPIVVPLPAWAASLGAFGEIKAENGIVTYKLSKAWPAEPLEIQINEKTLGSLWSLWSLFPLVGGRNFGIPPTQATLEVEAKTDGSGSVESAGKTGFQAAGQELEGKLGGKGKLQYEAGKGLEWKGASLVLGVDGTIKKEVGPITLIPALEGAVNLCCGIGSTMKWFNSMAKIEGTIKAGAALDLQIVSADGKLGFHAAEGDLSNGVGLGLAADMGKMKVQVTGGGTNKAYWQFPASPGYLKKIEAELVAKIAMDVWLFTKEFEAKHTFVYPESAAPQSLEAPPEVSGDFQPLSRNFLSLGDYNRFVPGTSPIRAPMSVDVALRTAQATVGAETPVVTNVYPRSEPAITSNNGKSMLAYVFFDPGKATLQATDIYFSYDGGLGFPQPAALRSDTRAEFSPALAFDSQGKVVAVWERVKDTNFTGTEIGEMAALMEIVYALYDPATAQWTDPVALTDNGFLDHSPLLKRAPDGKLMLLWRSNQGNLLIGDAVMPTRLHYALWNGSGFGAADTLPGTFENCLTFSLAYGSNGAMLAYTRDMDGDLATTLDQEIFSNAFDGSAWSGAVRLTDDTVADVNPQVLYRSDGSRELVWRRGTDLVRRTNWDTGSTEAIRTGCDSVTFADFRAAITTPDDRLILYWQGIDPQGIDLFYSVYDAPNTSWSDDLRLTRDADMERDFQGAFSADGVFHLVYNKQNLETGATALYQLNYALAADVAVPAEGLSIDPAAPVPGEETVLTARVENRGDLALKNVSVEFYLGDPAAGGVLIGNAAAEPSLIRAGSTGTASVAWTPPVQADSYRVYVRAVTDASVTDANVSNNTAYFDALKSDVKALQCRVEERGDGSIDVTAVVQNIGSIPTREIKILYRGDGRDLGLIRIPGLLPDKQAEVTYKLWIDLEFSRWQMPFEIVADPYDKIREQNETNNTATILYVPEAIFPMAYHFKGVAVGTSSPARTFTFTNRIPADVVIGDIRGSEGGVAQFALQNDTCTGKTLASGSSCTFAAVFTPSTLGVQTASFAILSGSLADTGAILAEMVLSGGLPLATGDVNGSGTVDLADAVVALQVMSSQAVSPVYAAAAVGGGGRLGMKEAVAILQHLAGLRTLPPQETPFE